MFIFGIHGHLYELIKEHLLAVNESLNGVNHDETCVCLRILFYYVLRQEGNKKTWNSPGFLAVWLMAIAPITVFLVILPSEKQHRHSSNYP